MKFDQSVEYNMAKNFLEKSNIKCGRKISPRAFSRNLNLSITLDQQSDVLYSSRFYCIHMWRDLN